jgi:hypothetical protein
MLPSVLEKGIHRRALMSHAVRRMTAAGRAPMITSDALDSFWTPERPRTPEAQSNDLLLRLGDDQLSPDTHWQGSGYFLGAWIGTSLFAPKEPHRGLRWILRHAHSEGWLANYELVEHVGRRGDEHVETSLTMRGWEKYAALKKLRSESKTAFVAMKFGDKVLDSVVEKCFKPAVVRTGFELRKLTDNQPAGLIDDQIRASLLSARFVIADLTHGSHGAYWEAGFAEGLGIPVIYTCEKLAWKEKKTHFDTNHLLTILWDETDLKGAGDALTATIRATLRAEAIQQD